MTIKNIMLLINSLEKLFKALQILLPKMKRKTDFDIKNCNSIFQAGTPTYIPGITVTPNQNSFFKLKYRVILKGY